MLVLRYLEVRLHWCCFMLIMHWRLYICFYSWFLFMLQWYIKVVKYSLLESAVQQDFPYGCYILEDRYSWATRQSVSIDFNLSKNYFLCIFTFSFFLCLFLRFYFLTYVSYILSISLHAILTCLWYIISITYI